MGRDFVKKGFWLIGTYLVVVYATGSGKVIYESSRGVGRVIEAFQGRSNVVTGA